MSDPSPAVDDESPDQRPSPTEIREGYGARADRRNRPSLIDRLLKGRYRRRHFARAAGRVLDVACGMGSNYHHLPAAVEYVGVDATRGMLETTRARFEDRRERVPGLADGALAQVDAAALPFPDDGFDAVVSSFSTCTFPDPVAALQEMGRVCAPDGRILLLEHGRSDLEPLARLQDWRANTALLGDVRRWNRVPESTVARAGLPIEAVRTWLAGVVTAIEARPPA